MFALPAAQAAWLLYERARALTGAASHIGGWISLLLGDVDSEVRVLLEQLLHRVDALTPALTYTLAWASDKGSAVNEVVFTAKSNIFRIEQFIHTVTKQKGQIKLIDRGRNITSPSKSMTGTMLLTAHQCLSVSLLLEWLIRNLKTHLKALDFSIARSTSASNRLYATE